MKRSVNFPMFFLITVILVAGCSQSPEASIVCYQSVQDAMGSLENLVKEGDQVVVFGSFYTVAEALQRGV